VRPHGKTPPRNLRRTIEAILWRHQNGGVLHGSARWRLEQVWRRRRSLT
jgi:hypothetical protein